MILAFVAAEAREFDGLIEHTERIAKLDWPLSFARRAWLNGREIVMAANGPGPKLAAQAANVIRQHEELEELVSTGFCGALNPALKACDIFVATEVAHALSVPRSHSCERRYQEGILLSLDRVISTAAEKSHLHQTGADAVEMEAAGVAERAAHWNVPFSVIRVVTDTAHESFPLDFNQLRDREGRFDRVKILGAAFRKPAAFPALLRLNQRCKAASKALGDYIADTRF